MTSRPHLQADPQEIIRALAVLCPPGAIVELRIPKTEREGTVSGYFQDHAALAKCLASRNGDPGIYLTLNPCNPALLARAANRIKIRVQITTSDKDIVVRIWLLIDIDAVRPAGISSSDAEHEAALERARTIRSQLGEEAWPRPVFADSGNGAHLLYRIDLPNDADAAALIEAVLKALAARFNDTAVQVDVTVFNAARISKLYGTPVRKGDDTPERPHRLSRLLHVPQSIEPVTRELLEEMAARIRPQESPAAEAEAPRPARGKGSKRRFNIEDFIARHLDARAPIAYGSGRKWVLNRCPFNPEHQQDAAVYERAGGKLGFRCFHNSCAGKNWKAVRALFEPAGQQSRKGQHGDWHDLLLRNEEGKQSRTTHNAVLHLENDLAWKDVVGYNELTGTPVVLATPPEPITTPIGAELDDNFDTGAVIWFERVGLPVAPAVVRSAMDFFARKRAYHPICDYLNGLKWDGVERLDTWLIVHANATARDLTRDPNRNPVYYSAYLAAVGSKFFISGIARARRPGCQVDTTIVFQGAQGTYKTSTLRVLAVRENWFTDQVRDFGKEAEQLLRGIWIAELSELAVLTSKHTEMERAKGFLSQRDAHLRLPYGHRPTRFPRSCIFAGTTNAEEFLRDETGNRRFLCVRCGPINLEGLRAVVDQLWAEADVRFQRGEPWWITDPKILEAAEEEQRDRIVTDSWEGEVMKHARDDLAREGSTSIPAILIALNVSVERQDQTHKNRVARILRLYGWERFHAGPRAAREWRYKPAQAAERSGVPVDKS
jgi:predicted P-loop ATPase